MGSHRAEGSALRRQATPVAPVHGRRRAQPLSPTSPGRRAQRAARPRVWARGLPQACVVGVLGVATIVAPLAGDVVLDRPASVAEAATATTQQPQHPQAQAPVAVSDFRVVPSVEPEPVVPPASVVSAARPPISPEQLAEMRSQAEQAGRDYERSVLPGCDGQVRQSGAGNGQLGTDDLCRLWEGDHMLRADAAVTLARLNVQYQNAFGESLCLTDSYRSYSAQARLRAIKPGLAAPAGTSEHGWGLAVDLCGGVERIGDRYNWLRDNAPQFGWDNPDWARQGGSGPFEPWHWEFVAGQA